MSRASLLATDSPCFLIGFLSPQVVVFAVTHRTRITETRLAGTGTYPRCPSALRHHQPRGTPQVWVPSVHKLKGLLLLCPLSCCGSGCRWHSHCFTWGYGRLLSLLVRLPADLSSKQRMAESCRSHGYWMGYLRLCREMQQRTEAFSTICYLDDISLLEDPEGRSEIFLPPPAQKTKTKTNEQ